ncbi:MAG: phosphatidylserine decarboxylase [Candidatus Thermoplasmatota archaeon]
MIRIAEGGMPWVLAGVAFTFIFLGVCYFTSGWLFLVFCILTVFSFLISFLLLVFFRDPERIIGRGVTAVADGKIREIINLQDAEVGECVRISTFMNIHNVHVNRAPFTGTIEKMTHHPGGHVPAFQKESDANEQLVLLLKTEIGGVKIVQIAGAVARRIVPYVSEGMMLKKGEKIGLIRLGSRVDLYLPAEGVKAVVIQMHERIKAGEDTIAEIND